MFATCYERPTFRHNQRLKVIAFFTLRDYKLQKWQRSHQDLLRSAIIGKHEQKLLRKSFNLLIDFVLKSKRKRIIRQTVKEFRELAIIERSLRIWRLFCMLRRKEKLMIQVADEFREEKLRCRIYKGNLNFTKDTRSGDLVSSNHTLQQKVFSSLKSLVKSKHEGRLKQILRAKNQILLVRCFLSWRSLAKF